MKERKAPLGASERLRYRLDSARAVHVHWDRNRVVTCERIDVLAVEAKQHPRERVTEASGMPSNGSKIFEFVR